MTVRLCDSTARSTSTPPSAPAEDDAPLRSVSIAMARARLLRARGRAGRHPGGRASSAIAKSTACRMLAALAAGGMLERTGVRALPAGPAAVRDRPARRRPADAARAVALPVLGELREVLRETAQLARAGRRRRALRRPAGGRGRHDVPHRAVPARPGALLERRARRWPRATRRMATGDPRARVRPAHAVHDRRPAALPAGAATRSASDGLRGLARGAHAGLVLDRRADP